MKIGLRFCALAVFVIVALGFATAACAQRGTTPQTIDGLGTATFPTSAKSDAAQTAFVRGLVLLHLFEY